MAVQLAWNLDTTSTSTVQVVKGVLFAATTDNVQPLAVMACEKFGNTLAVCPNTLRKIEHSVIPTPQHAVLAFLKGTVGYSKHDCVSYFGRSQAGLQFLALASALATWPVKHKAAESLHAMLVRTAQDKTLVPTARQIKDLLIRIEPRCHRSGFADEVFGWNSFLTAQSVAAGSQRELGPFIPDVNGLGNLVDALRQVNRIGAADVVSFTVETAHYAPWTIAFIKWSLGYPPTVTLGKNGMTVLEQPDSRVNVVIPNEEGDSNFSITIYSSIRGPSELVTTGYNIAAIGMISLHNYGQRLLDECSIQSGINEKAFRETIPYVICRAMNRFSHRPHNPIQNTTSTPNGQLPDADNLETKTPSIIDSVNSQRVSPLRNEGSVRTIYRLLFNEELDMHSHQDQINVSDLPHVALAIKGCKCSNCDMGTNKRKKAVCRKDQFLDDLSGIAGDVLALSLFDCPDLLQVSSQAIDGYTDMSDMIKEYVCAINDGGASKEVEQWPRDVFDRALQITGHAALREGKIPPDFAISSVHGQAVWPTIFESHSYCKGGYSSLSWYPGFLSYDGESFDLAAIEPGGSSTASAPPPTPPTTNINTPCNLFPHLELDWEVWKSDENLGVCLGVRAGSDKYRSLVISPLAALQVLDSAILVKHCQHPATAELASFRMGLKVTGPFKPGDSLAEISIVAVDGDDSLRFLALSALANSDRVVLRNTACLTCCLEVCKIAKASVLIL